MCAFFEDDTGTLTSLLLSLASTGRQLMERYNPDSPVFLDVALSWGQERVEERQALGPSSAGTAPGDGPGRTGWSSWGKGAGERGLLVWKSGRWHRRKGFSGQRLLGPS